MIELSLKYNRVGADVLPWCESIRYTDVRVGTASELEIVLNNADGRFMSSWRATKGDAIALKFGKAKLVQMSIDKISVNFSPRTVTWSAIARPVNSRTPSDAGSGIKPPAKGSALDTKKSRDMIKKITFSALLKKLCSDCGMAGKFYPKTDPVLTNVVQFRESAFSLLSRYCRIYGFGLNASADTVCVLAAAPKVGDKDASDSTGQVCFPLSKACIEKLASASDIEPQKVVSARLDPRTGKVIKESYGDGQGKEIDVSGELGSAQLVYEYAEKRAFLSSFTIVPDDRIVAGVALEIDETGVVLAEKMVYSRTADKEAMTIDTVRAKT